MPLQSLIRNPSRYVRIALAMLLMAFAADTIAHVTHTHDSQQVGSHSEAACGYCAAFNGIVDAPAQLCFVPAAQFGAAIFPTPSWQFVDVRSACSAQPRAPPFL